MNDDNLKVLELIFEGNQTLVVLKEWDVYIGMRSVVEGIGLSWHRQRKKIDVNHRTLTLKYRRNARKYNGMFLHKEFVTEYFNSVNPNRISDNSRNIFLVYKERFIDFIDKIIEDEKADDHMDIWTSYVETGIDGVRALIRDMVKINYLAGFEKTASIMNDLLEKENITEDELIVSNRIYDIADYLSKNQFRLRS